MTSIVLDKMAGELAGIIEEAMDATDLVAKEGGYRRLKLLIRNYLLTDCLALDLRIMKDVPLMEVADAADDEDDYDAWYKNVWSKGSTADWMAKYFGETEGLVRRTRPVAVEELAPFPEKRPVTVTFDKDTGEIHEPTKTNTEAVELDD